MARPALRIALWRATRHWPMPLGGDECTDLALALEEWRKQERAHARAQALRDAAETIPEVGDVLRGMAAREVGGDE